MKKRIYLTACMALALAGTQPLWSAKAKTAPEPTEQHIYLHVVAPEDGSPVKLFIQPAPDTEVVLPETVATPAAAEDITSEPTVTEDPAQDDQAAIEEYVATEEPEAGDETITLADTADDDSSAQQEDAAEATEDLALDTAIAMEESATAEKIDEADEQDIALIAGAEEAEVETPPAAEVSSTSMGLLLFTFILAIFLGFELISKVPSQLHTPLMSGANAISGITIVGALAVAGTQVGGPFSTLLGTLAVIFAAINVVGGYLVTDRMLGMFKKKDGGRS